MELNTLHSQICSHTTGCNYENRFAFAEIILKLKSVPPLRLADHMLNAVLIVALVTRCAVGFVVQGATLA